MEIQEGNKEIKNQKKNEKKTKNVKIEQNTKKLRKKYKKHKMNTLTMNTLTMNTLTIDTAIEPIDLTELGILKENIARIMNNETINLMDTTERYIRYLQEIDDWLSYDYLKNDILDFLNEHDNGKKYKMMVSIDMTLFKFLRDL